MKKYYQNEIRKYQERTLDLSVLSYSPRHIEAWMRLGHGCLDGLPEWKFNNEIKIAIDCIKHGGLEQSEKLAASFGL